LGVWLEPDTIGYGDGMNVYQMEHDDTPRGLDPVGTRWFDGWGEAVKALFGQAEPSVQHAFDTCTWDRTQGTKDAVARRGSRVAHAVAPGQISPTDSVGGVTFDPQQRASADRAAGAIIDTTAAGVSVVSGAQALTGLARAGGVVTGALSNGQTVTQVVVSGQALAGAAASGATAVGSGAVAAEGLLHPSTGSPPNPYGQYGKPDHQRTVAKLKAMAEREYPNGIIHENESICKATKGQVNRKPDVWVEDRNTGQVLKVYEAARRNADGTFVSREGAKQVEYDAARIPSVFAPVQ